LPTVADDFRQFPTVAGLALLSGGTRKQHGW